MLGQQPIQTLHTQVERAIGQQPASKDRLIQHFQHFIIFCQVEGFSTRTIKNYKQILNKFISYCRNELGYQETSRITTYDVRAYLLHFKDHVKPETYHNYQRGIKRYFNWLVSEGIIPVSPMATMKPPRLPKTLIQPFFTDNLRLLISACDTKTFIGIRNKAIILTFLDTGLRLSELANIKIDDVDFNRGIIKVMGKGARERVVALQHKTQKALLHYLVNRKDKYPCLWVTEEHRPLYSWGIYRMIYRLGKQIGIQNVRCSPHTFRHTFATMCLENGAGEFEVQAMLGHSTLTMTRRYVATLNSEKAAEAHKRFSPVEHLRL